MKLHKLSVVVPALNEEDTISSVIYNLNESFVNYNIDGEIIVINDGSTDSTENIIKDLQKKLNNITLINHISPKGIGKTIWEGYTKSRSDLVTWIPADGENDAFELLRYIDLMNEVDIVVPFIYNKGIRSYFRRIVSIIFKAIINISFMMLLNYSNGLVIYRRSILLDLKLNSLGFFWSTEILLKLIKQGYLYAEVPMGLKKRESGKSKALSLKALLSVILGYLHTLITFYFTNSILKNLNEESVSYKRTKLIERNNVH